MTNAARQLKVWAAAVVVRGSAMVVRRTAATISSATTMVESAYIGVLERCEQRQKSVSRLFDNSQALPTCGHRRRQ